MGKTRRLAGKLEKETPSGWSRGYEWMEVPSSPKEMFLGFRLGLSNNEGTAGRETGRAKVSRERIGPLSSSWTSWLKPLSPHIITARVTGDKAEAGPRSLTGLLIPWLPAQGIAPCPTHPGPQASVFLSDPLGGPPYLSWLGLLAPLHPASVFLQTMGSGRQSVQVYLPTGLELQLPHAATISECWPVLPG